MTIESNKNYILKHLAKACEAENIAIDIDAFNSSRSESQYVLIEYTDDDGDDAGIKIRFSDHELTYSHSTGTDVPHSDYDVIDNAGLYKSKEYALEGIADALGIKTPFPENQARLDELQKEYEAARAAKIEQYKKDRRMRVRAMARRIRNKLHNEYFNAHGGYHKNFKEWLAKNYPEIYTEKVKKTPYDPRNEALARYREEYVNTLGFMKQAAEQAEKETK